MAFVAWSFVPNCGTTPVTRPRSEPLMAGARVPGPQLEGPEQRPSSYMVLLNSLASDLDLMLNDLCTTPPPGQQPPASEGSLEDVRGEAFLEPYMQGLPVSPRESPLLDATNSEEEEEEEDEEEAAPASPPPAPDLATKLRLIQLAGVTPPVEQVPQEDTTSDDEDSSPAPCDIGLLERLIRSHPVWFLAGLQRAGAVHLLQGKEEGNFVVRQSSQADTMAISVRLPPGKGPYIEHYLVQPAGNGQLALESSENRFDDIPTLVAHYAQCCDELPVQLSLPRAIREARNRQQLSSLALLGQEFWRYPMANPRPGNGGPMTEIPGSAPQATPPSLRPSPPPRDDSSHSSLSSLGSNTNLTALNNLLNNNEEPIVLDLAPLGDPPSRAARPNTLNLLQSTAPSSPLSPASLKGDPPKPPPRWAKPSQNFTVTTTVTFNVNPPTHVVEVQLAPKDSPAVENETTTVVSPTVVSPAVSTPSVVTPSVVSPSENKPATRRAKRKVSNHYRECDILESPTVYYRSSVADKISDYEDIWGPSPGQVLSSPAQATSPAPATPELLTFKPRPPSELGEERRPDLLGSCGALPCRASPLNSPASPVSPLDPSKPGGSPFYAEPADAIRNQLVRRRPGVLALQRTRVPASHRHSDPTLWRAVQPNGRSQLERIDSTEEMHAAASADNIAMLRSPCTPLGSPLTPTALPLANRRQQQQPRGKPVQPPRVLGKVKGIPSRLGDGSWAVDSSWEFFGSQAGSPAEEVGRFPSLDDEEEDSLGPLQERRRPLTAQQLIAEKCPELGLPPDCSLPGLLSPGLGEHLLACRMSSYDNVEGRSAGSSSQASDEDAHTVFSEPWDSARWETLLMDDARLSGEPQAEDDEATPSLARTKSFRDRMDPLLSPPRLQALRSREGGSTGATIRAYALQLAADSSTTFAQNIENFISCTRESKERSPHVAMRNMRQFMSGMKNYLVKHGERGFEKEVEKERLKLRATEFLNLDAILEGVMHKLVVRPLREHLYRLFVAEYTRSGAIQLLASNIQYARTKPAHELGIRAKISPPSERSLHTICHYLSRLQQVDSPLEKLENLLACISSIFNSVKSSNQGRGGVLLGADDFLPLFVWVLVRGGMVAAEIEAEFMWGLLQPSLLSGEGGYYLTTLSSAVHVLKNFRACSEAQNPSLDWRGGSLAELRSVLRIVVPDELHGSILTKTLPVRPNTTTRDVCKIIAHKIRITNPQDYGLYKLVDGEETLLNEGECPQDVKDIVSATGKHCVFAYKRIDAKIAWPRASPSPGS